ncbi:MAG: response regulator [Pirellulaceae bacterium]|nr:response regulator [Pirellulaceae bacterium]
MSKSIVAIHNTNACGTALKQVLQLLLRVEVKPFQVGPEESIAEVLPRLNQICSDTDTIYINGGLVFKQSRQTRSHLGGLEFLLHLRLTADLLPLSRLSAVIGAFEDPVDLIRRTPDNCLICSPGTGYLNPLRLFAGIHALLNNSGYDDNLPRKIIPYISLTEFDEQRGSHGLLNRLGIGKLLSECAADVVGMEHPLVAQYQELLATDLWAKKAKALKPHWIASKAAKPDELLELRQRFLAFKGRPTAVYIDDEHVHGWSLGLYMTLTGQTCSHEPFQGTGTSYSPCGRMTCIDNRDDAVTFFEQQLADFEAKLEQWSEADHKSMLTVVAAKKAKANATRLKQELQQAANERQATEKTLNAAKSRAVAQQLTCAEQIAAFKDLAWQVADVEDAPGLGLLESVPELRKILPTFQESIAAYEKAARAAQQAEEAFTKASTRHARLTAESREADVASTALEKESIEAGALKAKLEKEISTTYPCSVTFLDLRLNPRADETCPIEETTGMSVLHHIKNTFPFMPIVMMTASQQASSSETVRLVGATGYWIKGVHDGEQFTRVLDLALDQAELREHWVKLRMLQEKQVWWCAELSGNIKTRNLFHPEEEICAEERLNGLRYGNRLNGSFEHRLTILEKLEEALLLLWQFGKVQQSESMDRRDHPFDQVVLMMGQIQELRFRNVKDKDWEKVYSYIGTLAGNIERELRRFRNDLAHSKDPFKSRQDAKEFAIKFLQYTLDALLMNRPPKVEEIDELFEAEMGLESL